MRLACVVHRFGAEIAGGSEGHCRAIAGCLAGAGHDVTVLTTCAADHVTWKNAFPPGASTDGALRVLRFPVARTRSRHRFAEISEIAFGGDASAAEEEQWFRENGPEAPELLDHLTRHAADYDRILFWSFRYYTTFFGVPLVADRAVLVPTAEDDGVIRFEILETFFAKPSAFLFLTPEEQSLVARYARRPPDPSCIVGTGLDPVASAAANGSFGSLGIDRPFVLYLGRIDPHKGCETLIRHFLRLQELGRAKVPLVLAGPVNMPVPDHRLLRCLGQVPDGTREALLSNAAALVVPSPYESLSIALLEAWNHAVPALVNGWCDVLKGQALRSGGALYYRDFDEFASGLEYLIGHPAEAGEIGRQGLAYVDREYRWPLVTAKLERFLTTNT
jgi:glycosyltransferase involved in cell wall biosynthesis